MAEFVHLHLHTEYSLLDGMCRIDAEDDDNTVFALARKLKMPSVAVTDHGKMFGAIQFYKKALEHGIKPIIGCEFYLAPRSRFDKKGEKIGEAYSHLTALARTETGYRNLMLLSSLAHTEGFYHRPRIDRAILEKFHEGLILLSGCLKGDINSLLIREDLEEATKSAAYYRDVFGPDFYLEIQNHGIPEQLAVLPGLAEIGRRLNIPLVATNDCHYLHQKDSLAHDALLCIQTGSLLEETSRMKFSSDQFHFRTPEEMENLFREFPDAIKNTLAIAEKCNVELEFGKSKLPHYDTPEGFTRAQYLEKLVKDGLRKRYQVDYDNPTKEQAPILDRVKMELSVIEKMGYPGYFLIIQDIVGFAKSNGISVGPGRGSAVGSIVAYLTGITDVDPLKYDLIFERFLNPDRVKLPDIDIDFEDRRRDEVISYVHQKYGENQVAQIATFGTLSARSVIRDVGRVMGMAYADVDRIAKLVPEELHITLSEALKREEELAALVRTDENVRRLFEISRVLEGLPRHASTHAAGIVIADRALYEYVPLFLGTNDVVTSQYDMNSVSEVGLLKIDLLGLKTLTVIDSALRLISARTGKPTSEFPLDDRRTYQLLSKANSFGIFQLESGGMRDLLRKVAPSTFEDIIALLALYRPGPLGSGMVNNFIDGKRTPEKITYEHPTLKEILKSTYGVILYQEQVMEVVHRLGGLTLSQSDLFRQAMGKKVPEIMEKYREQFVKGAKKNGLSEKSGAGLFEKIVKFAGYGFNKSHSTGYALICYQTAYLKAHYPLEFMAALLTSEIGNSDKITEYIDECKRMGIKILPPSVRESDAHFTVAGNDLRFGMAAIKNVGFTAIESIVKSREAAKEDRTFFDFCRRVDLRLVNKKVLESLIKAGAFDFFQTPRSQLLALIPFALNQAGSYQEDKRLGQTALFDVEVTHNPSEQITGEISRLAESSESEILAGEKEVLGFYLSGHPLASYADILKRFSTHSVQGLASVRPGSNIRLGGIVEKVKRLVSKKDRRKMASFTFEDLTGKIEAMVFPETFEKCGGFVHNGHIIFLEGKVDSRSERTQLMVSEIVPVSEGIQRYAKNVEVSFFPTGLEEKALEKFQKLLETYPGQVPLFLKMRFSGKRAVVLKTGVKFKIAPDESFVRLTEDIFGPDSVSLS